MNFVEFLLITDYFFGPYDLLCINIWTNTTRIMYYSQVTIVLDRSWSHKFKSRQSRWILSGMKLYSVPLWEKCETRKKQDSLHSSNSSSPHFTLKIFDQITKGLYVLRSLNQKLLNCSWICIDFQVYTSVWI